MSSTDIQRRTTRLHNSLDQRPSQTAAKHLAKAAPNQAAAVRVNLRCKASTNFWWAQNEAADIDVFTRDLSGFHKSDSVHYDALLYGCIEQREILDA